jgi:hypothetical protein
MNQIIELKGEQAEQVPYPIGCPIYIYGKSSDEKSKEPRPSQSEFIISNGTISQVFLQICSLSSAPELLYKVAHAKRCQNTQGEGRPDHDTLLRGESLRLRNACPIYVKCDGEILKGVVLGTCDIPLPESTQEHTGDKFWYSVAVREDGVDEGEAVSTIIHEVCQASVTYRSQKEEVACEDEIPQAIAEIVPPCGKEESKKRDTISSSSQNEVIPLHPTFACEFTNAGTGIENRIDHDNAAKSHEQEGKVITCGEKGNSIHSVVVPDANPVLDPKLVKKRPAEFTFEYDDTTCSSAKRSCNGIRSSEFSHSQDIHEHRSSQHHFSTSDENERLCHRKEHPQDPHSFGGSSSHHAKGYHNLDRYQSSSQKSQNTDAAEISVHSENHLENHGAEYREFPGLARESVLRFQYNSVAKFPVAQCDMAAILIGQGGTKLKELKNELKCKIVVVGDSNSTEVFIFGNYAPNLEKGIEVIKSRVSEQLRNLRRGDKYNIPWVEEETYVDYCVGNKICRSSRGNNHSWSQEDSFDSRINQGYEHNRSSDQNSSYSPRFDQRRQGSSVKSNSVDSVSNYINSPEDPHHLKRYHRLILPNVDSATVNKLSHAVIGPGGCNHKRFLRETGCMKIKFTSVGGDVYVDAASQHAHDSVNSLQYILDTLRKELRLEFREASFHSENNY